MVNITDQFATNLVGDKRERGFVENMRNMYAYNYGPIVSQTNEMIEFADQPVDPNYKFWEDISGYEDFASELSRAKNKNHADFIKQRISNSLNTRKELEDTPWYSGGALMANVLDPLNILFPIPFMKASTPLLRGGMSVGQGIVSGAKSGLAIGVASEMLRAPFDPVATMQESAANVLTTTVFSGLLGGAIPFVINSTPRVKNAIKKTREELMVKGDILKQEVGDTNINYLNRIDGEEVPENVLLKRPVTSNNAAVLYDKEANTIHVDEKLIDIEYDNKFWTNDGFKDHEFITRLDYQDYRIIKEKLFATTKRNAGENEKDFNLRISKLAKEKSDKGWNPDLAAGTNNFFFRMLSTPGKRIQYGNTPELNKKDHQLLSGHAVFANERNLYGRGHQSIEQRMATHEAKAQVLQNRLRDLYSQAVLKGNPLDIFGTDLNFIRRWGKDTMSQEEFVNQLLYRYVENSEKWATVARMQDATDLEKTAFNLINEYFQGYNKKGTHLNLWRSNKTVNETIFDLEIKISDDMRVRDSIIAQSEGKKQKVGITEKQSEYLNKLNERIARNEDDLAYNKALLAEGIETKDFHFPINYDKVKIKERKDDFISIIEDWVRKNPKKYVQVWNKETKQFDIVEQNLTPKEIAARTYDRIVNEEYDEALSLGGYGSKHTMMRQLDIPEYLVKDFIHTGSNVINSYARQVGFKLEWTEKFGRQTLDDVLDNGEIRMREQNFKDEKAGKKPTYSEDDIANYRRDFTEDYRYITKTHIRNVDRWDQTIVRSLKTFASMTYLDGAGLASVTDIGAMVFEHGFGKVLRPLMSKEYRQQFQYSKAESQKIVRSLELSGLSARERFYSGEVQGFNPNRVDRVMDKATDFYYNTPILGNNLGPITHIFKNVEAVVRQDDLLEKIYRIYKNSAKDDDVRYLARYGIDESDARNIAEKQTFKEKELSFANLDSWGNSPKDLELKEKFSTALNTGVANTIMHATAFDKPIIARGSVFVRWYPWMKDVPFFKNLEIDKQVSTANRKYTRIEHGVLTMPFQFYDWTFAATNRITTGLMDPQRENRLVGAMTLFAMGYFALTLKKDDWWFESKSFGEILQRTFNQSGIMGLYGDIAYMGLHMLMATGQVDPDNKFIYGKYKPTGPEAELIGLGGAVPGWLHSIYTGTSDLLEGKKTKAAAYLSYQIPLLKSLPFGRDVAAYTSSLIRD